MVSRSVCSTICKSRGPTTSFFVSHVQIKGREDEFEYINIGEHIRYLSAFMRMRDTSPVFDHCREIGDVGVPAFVFEDGTVSIYPADAGLIEFGSPNACSNEDHKN